MVARRHVECRPGVNPVVERLEVRSEADGDVVSAVLQLRLVLDQFAVRCTQAAHSQNSLSRNATRKVGCSGGKVHQYAHKLVENARTM